MKAIELSEKYFYEFGLPMIKKLFPSYLKDMCFGISGQGSECFGYDDNLSLDHDYRIGFCIWLTDSVYDQIGFKLMRAYNELPKEYMGIKLNALSLYARNKFGVFTIKEFFLDHLGKEINSWQSWLYTPSYAFAESTNGKIFMDNLGEFTKYRNHLLNDMPLDCLKQKLCATLTMMAQYGEYNYPRLLKRGEVEAALLAKSEFIKEAIEMVFLLNQSFMPFYKWQFRKMEELEKVKDVQILLKKLIKVNSNDDFDKIEEISKLVTLELIKQGFLDKEVDYLENAALEIKQTIINQEIKALHIMEK